MKYIIELVADSKGVQAGVDALEQIGKVDKENAAQFKKTNEEVKKYTSSLNEVSKGVKEVSKAATGAFGTKAIHAMVDKTKLVLGNVTLLSGTKPFEFTSKEDRRLPRVVSNLKLIQEEISNIRKKDNGIVVLDEDTKAAISFKSQIKQSRDELTKLIITGEATTSQIYDMAASAGELKDNIGDAQQAINVLSSDTFKLDAALQGIQVGAIGFQIMQGATALAGKESEDLQRTLIKLNAVMAITQGLQQIQNALQKQTALSLGLNIAAQKTYTLVVGTSTGALKAFRIALAATGIGLAVIAIAALVQNWDKLKLSILGATQSSEDFIKAKEKSLEMSEKELESLETELKYRQAIGKINDVQAQEERLKYVSLKSLKTTEELQKETEKLKQMTKDSKEFITVQDMKFDKTVKYAKVNQSQLDEQVKKVNYLISLQKQQVGTIDEERKALEDLIESKKEKIKVEKKEADKAKQDLDKAKQDLDKFLKDIDKLRNDAQKARTEVIQEELDRELKLLEFERDQKNKAINDERDRLVKEAVQLKQGKAVIEQIHADSFAQIVANNEQFYKASADLREKYEKELKEEAYQRDIKNLNDAQAAQRLFYSQLYAQGKIDKSTFDQNISDLDKAGKQQLLDIAKKYGIDVVKVQQDITNDKIKVMQQEIEAQKEKELTIKETAVSIAQETADTIFQIAANRRNAEFNAQLSALNAQKERELSNKNLTDAQKARIEERYQKQVAALKTRQAQQEKQAAIIQATINGALAITNILATMPGGPLNPATIASLVIAGVTTATNIALIASQKIPKFAKGTEYVQGAGTETSDSIPAMLSKGERVIDAKTNKMLKGIPNSMLPELLVPSKTVISKGMDYDKLAKTLSKELAKSPQMRVSFDKEGFNSYIMSRNNTTNIKNNRYDF